MAVRATIAPAYRWRLGGATLLFIIMAAWFMHDGWVVYPRQNKLAEVYDQFVQAGHPASQWAEVAENHGWPQAFPTEPPPRHSWFDIQFQRVMGLAVAALAVIFGVWFVGHLGRWIEGDATGLTTRSGRRIAYDQVTTLDKTRWKNKGIAVVHHRSPEGRPGRIVLDDYRYDASATDAIRKELEAHLRPEQIVGGTAPAPAAAPPPASPGQAPPSPG